MSHHCQAHHVDTLASHIAQQVPTSTAPRDHIEIIWSSGYDARGPMAGVKTRFIEADFETNFCETIKSILQKKEDDLEKVAADIVKGLEDVRISYGYTPRYFEGRLYSECLTEGDKKDSNDYLALRVRVEGASKLDHVHHSVIIWELIHLRKIAAARVVVDVGAGFDGAGVGVNDGQHSVGNTKTDRVLIVRDEGTDMKLGNTQLATVDEAEKAVSTERGDGKGGGNNGTSVLTQKVAVRGQQTTARKTSPFRSQLAKLDEADEDANLRKRRRRSRRTAVPITAPKPNAPGFVPETTSDPVVERGFGGANRYPPPSPPNPPPTADWGSRYMCTDYRKFHQAMSSGLPWAVWLGLQHRNQKLTDTPFRNTHLFLHNSHNLSHGRSFLRSWGRIGHHWRALVSQIKL